METNKPNATSIFDEILEKYSQGVNANINELYSELKLVCQLGKIQAIQIDSLQKRVDNIEKLLNAAFKQ